MHQRLDPSGTALQQIEEVVVSGQRLEHRPRRRGMVRAKLKITISPQRVRIRPHLELRNWKGTIFLQLVRPPIKSKL